MPSGRHILIGDVHGCLSELRSLLDRVEYVPCVDRAVFLGDLIDKGPDSAGTLRLARQIVGSEGGICLMGNHERKCLIRFGLISPVAFPWETPDEPDGRNYDYLTEADLSWMMTLPYTQRIDPFLAVHAGVCPLSHDCPSGTPDAFHEAVFTSIRFVDSSWHPVQLDDSHETVVPWYEIYDGRLGIVVFGHHPYFDEVESVRIAPHAVGLDSGCWFSGRLSALVVNADGSTKVVSTVS